MPVPGTPDRNDMLKKLRSFVMRGWNWSQKGSRQRRLLKERARFWSEVRDGQHEAEVDSDT